MDAGTTYALAKLRIADLQREAEQDRLARLARETRTEEALPTGARRRLARLRAGFRPVRARGPRAAEA